MAADAGASRLAKFSVRRVIGDSVRVLLRNPLSFVLAALVVRVIWLVAPAYERPAGSELIREINWSLDIVRPVLGMLIAGLMTIVVAHGTLKSLQRQDARLGDIGRGLPSIVSVAIAGILFCLPGMIPDFVRWLLFRLMAGHQVSDLFQILANVGVVVLFAPAMVLAVAWCVSAPAIVFERRGPIAGLARSSQLTKGRRWSIVGLFLLVMIIWVVVLAPVAAATHMTIPELVSPATLSVGAAIGYLAQAVLSAFNAVMLTVTYCHLRSEKEGFGLEEVAHVFD
jgi:hypothetical protein